MRPRLLRGQAHQGPGAQALRRPRGSEPLAPAPARETNSEGHLDEGWWAVLLGGGSRGLGDSPFL